MAHPSSNSDEMEVGGKQVATLSPKSERLMKEFLRFRDMLDACNATKEQKQELWSQFLNLYTGMV